MELLAIAHSATQIFDDLDWIACMAQQPLAFIAVVNVAPSSGEAPERYSVLRQGDRMWKVLSVDLRTETARLLGAVGFDTRTLLLIPRDKTEGEPEIGRILLARGCCVDRRYGHGCNDDTCMANLPEGKSCANCIHVQTCVSIFGQEASAAYCQWFPRRFSEKERT